MRLGTIRIGDTTRAVRVEGDEVVQLDFADVGEVLCSGALDASRTADGGRMALGDVDWAPVVAEPNKIICVGMNYADHIKEMGHPKPPDHPTCFSKFSGSLIGANDDLHLPPTTVSIQNDWEAELTVVIGSPARSVTCLLYTSPSPRDGLLSRMPSSA